MSREEAIYTLAKKATDQISTRTVAEQIETYDALAVLMPKKKERTNAERIAWTLREAEGHQLQFQQLLMAL
jgi:hypothetical protein